MGNVVLNLNACTSAFYKPILVSHYLMDDSTFKDRNDRKGQLHGLRVQLTYELIYSGKPRSRSAMIASRIKSICGVGEGVGQQTFKLSGRDGKPDTEPTVEQHFERTYKIRALNSRMPAINCGTVKDPKWYLPEKLQILPYQLYKRKVSSVLTADMLTIACKHPKMSRTMIEQEGLRSLGLKPGTGFMPFNTKQSVITHVEVVKKSWEAFQKALQKTYAAATFQFAGHIVQRGFANNLSAAEAAMARRKNKRPISSYCFSKTIRTQHTLASNISPTANQSEGWWHQPHRRWGRADLERYPGAGSVSIALDVNKRSANLTIRDVTHPGPQSLIRTPSIAAIVGSVGSNGGKFLGSMRLQPHVKACEDIHDVEGMVLKRLRAWYSHNNRTLPKNILYYRDVKNNEVPQIRSAFAAFAKELEMTPPPDFKLTAVVVAKRHNMRNYPLPNEGMPKNGNCKPAHYFPLVDEMWFDGVKLQGFHTTQTAFVIAAGFLNRLSDPVLAAPHADFKLKLLKEAKEAREKRYISKRVQRVDYGRKVYRPSVTENRQEKADEDQVEQVLRQKMFEMAKKAFYSGDEVKNPWSESIAKTMFWM
ncbi:hypothetical protein CC86DRAFT_458662 [Ophiobolus disseminans]|uniref:Piwi domain-containing protein n=1 Tax=Ophiobolus disseminans TaxID=1469910 RepID=A0A6A6ZMN6_9PLEO|nr:hypothetical protein CC86DRAFT_458662 [Ophiobolus disseminans]